MAGTEGSPGMGGSGTATARTGMVIETLTPGGTGIAGNAGGDGAPGIGGIGIAGMSSGTAMPQLKVASTQVTEALTFGEPGVTATKGTVTLTGLAGAVDTRPASVA